MSDARRSARLLYADSGGTDSLGPEGEAIGGLAVPTVRVAASSILPASSGSDAPSRPMILWASGFTTITCAHEDRALERWCTPARSPLRSRGRDPCAARISCPNCGRMASGWFAARGSATTTFAAAESDYRLPRPRCRLDDLCRARHGCGRDPTDDDAACRTRWRYLSGWPDWGEFALPDHQPGAFS